MEKNKYIIIKELLNKNIYKLDDYKTVVNNGKPFFEKKIITLLREYLYILNQMNLEELVEQ